MKKPLNLLTPYLFLLPALIILGITVFFPAIQAFYYSFTNYDLIQPPQFIGFKNFQRLLQDSLFWLTLGHTLLYLIIVVPILVFLPLGLAILVNRPLKGINWFRAAYYTPVIISLVVAGIAWKFLYAENGLFNQLFIGIWSLTIGKILPAMELTAIPWLTSPNFALFSVMAVTIWKGLGYYMIIYLAGLQSISPEIYEASAIDGCDGWQKHWLMTVPLMRPYLILVAVISAIAATKVFEEVYIMTQGGPLNSSKTIVYYVYQSAFQDLEIGYACTIGLVLFLVILALSLLQLQMQKNQLFS